MITFVLLSYPLFLVQFPYHMHYSFPWAHSLSKAHSTLKFYKGVTEKKRKEHLVRVSSKFKFFLAFLSHHIFRIAHI